jgi:hypothetical protein
MEKERLNQRNIFLPGSATDPDASQRVQLQLNGRFALDEVGTAEKNFSILRGQFARRRRLGSWGPMELVKVGPNHNSISGGHAMKV